MGFLRKIAGLVVEFPDQQQPAAAHPAAGGHSGDDVLAAIEQARKDLEGNTTDFDAAVARPTSSGGAASAPASPPTATGTDNPSGIVLPGILSVAEVYERAKISSDPDGFDVYKVEAMLNDPEMADLAMDIRARMVKMTLKNMNHELHEVLLDAARRDQALEQYGQWLSGKVDDVSSQVAAANTQLQREVEEFIAAHNADIEKNKQALAQAHSGLQDFQNRKHAEEERLFNTVAPFVAPGENPVVVDSPASAGPKGPTANDASTQEKRK